MKNRFKFRVWNNRLGYFPSSDAGLIDYKTWFELRAMDNSVLEQCTGLKDKNGKLIYEGDIVRHDPTYSDLPYENLKVMWDEENAEFCFFCSQEMFAGQFADEYEVIGNIHENHELLDS